MKKKQIVLVLLTAMLTFCMNLPTYAAVRDPYDGFSTTLLDGSNIKTYNISSGYLGSTGANNYFYYENVNFGTVSPTMVELEIGVPEDYAGAVVEVRIDEPTGPLLASIVVQASSFNTALMHTAPIITPVTGMHTLYIKTGNKTANFFNIRFNKPLTGQDVYKVFESGDSFLDIKNSQYRDHINLLTQLGFLETGDYFYPQLFVKRKDFAEVLFKVLNVEEDRSSSQVFADVTADKEYYGFVNTLVQRGILIGYHDGYFYPEEFITKSDAMVMICRLLGYGDIAVSNGGYPQGYLKIANSQNLFDGLEGNENLRNGEMARLICNMFDAYYMELDTVSGEYVEYKEIKGILSKTMNIYKGFGQVTATNNTTLNVPETGLDYEHVEIDGEVFHVGETSAKALLGYDCDYYYISDKKGDEKILTAIMPRTSVQVTTVTSAEGSIDEISVERIVYEDSTGKQKRVNLDSNTAILYNGAAIDGNLNEYIEQLPLRGSIRYVQNPKGKDILFVDEYINIQIGMVDKDRNMISDSISDTVYELEEHDFYCIKNGEPVDFRRLEIKDVAMLYISKNKAGRKMVRLVVAGTSVEGTISSISEDEIKINDHIYTVSDEFLAKIKREFDENYTGTDGDYESAWNKELSVKINIGVSGVFYVNVFDEVVDFEVIASGEDMVGMVLSITAVDSEEEEPSYVKILTTDNTIARYPTADKIYVDGIRVREYNEISICLSELELSVINTPVRYHLDKKGRLTMLDTYLSNAGGQKDSLAKLFNSAAYNYSNGTRLLINTSTGRGTIPFATDGWLLSKWSNVLPEQYTFSKGGLSDSGNSGDVYTLDKDNETCDIFVWVNRGMHYNAASLILNEINMAVDQNDEVYYSVSGYVAAALVEYSVREDVMAGNSVMQTIVNEAKRGDCLRISTNDKKEITGMDLLYLHDSATALRHVDSNGVETVVEPHVSAGNRTWGDGGQKYRAVCATVVENMGDYIKISLGDSFNDDIEYIYVRPANLIKYDSARKTLEDGVAHSTIQKGDRIFVYISDRYTRTVAIYR